MQTDSSVVKVFDKAEPFYLLDFLKDNRYLDEKNYDHLRVELDCHLHYYGAHFKYPYEQNGTVTRNTLTNQLKRLYRLGRAFRQKTRRTIGTKIVSNAYFTVNDELERLDFDVYRPSWSIAKSYPVLANGQLLYKTEKLISQFRNYDFNYLISEGFQQEVQQFRSDLTALFYNERVQGLFVPNDVSFFENMAISVCKELNVSSFIFLHGLPGRYNIIDENRTDYLLVWGNKIKEQYIKTGFDPDKIYVCGHPYYTEPVSSHLKFDLDNILVITKSLNGATHSDGVILGDRGNLILYLYHIEKVLRSFGVKSARFRPHPSESGNWYLRFINRSFFKLDEEPLSSSLSKSSLVIGPTSTVFLESLQYGVNYVVYEPSVNNVDVTNYRLVPPFDGSDERIPVAKNETELSKILVDKTKVDVSCFHDYISTPFDISIVKDLIKRST